ncbi:MAG: hypothetical protein WBN22_04095 [Verrucomicrobiia bacterium]
MTKYCLKRTGKLLFPHLARDQRKRQMRVILLVALTTLSSSGGMSAWMAAAAIPASHAVMFHDMSL